MCGDIRIFNPLELRNNKEKKSICENKRLTKYREAESTFSGTPDDDGMITSLNSDVTIREAV